MSYKEVLEVLHERLFALRVVLTVIAAGNLALACVVAVTSDRRAAFASVLLGGLCIGALVVDGRYR